MEKNAKTEPQLSEEALETVTGGMNPAAGAVEGIDHFVYPSRTRQGGVAPGRVTLRTNDPSLPLHAEVMGRQKGGTVWQHRAVTRPDGQIEHHYDEVNDV